MGTSRRKKTWSVALGVALFAFSSVLARATPYYNLGAFVLKPAPACGGVMSAGFCWYFGAVGQSCVQVCSTHGGTTAGTLTYVGYPAGTLTNCVAVLGLLGQTGLTPNNNPYCSYPDGCARNNGNNAMRCVRHYQGLHDGTTQAAPAGVWRRVCSCVN